MTDTIHAVSSGRPPAAIAVIRVSGPQAIEATTQLCGTLPPPRQAQVRRIQANDGLLLDRALVLVFPGPASATGEDLVELHCHGGRAVVAAVAAALDAAGLRAAESGEFTRRALTNGRIDLAQAEGLADLLEAETEAQRRAAIDPAEGRVSKRITGWMARLASLSASVEAQLDFADEDDIAEHDLAPVALAMRKLADEIDATLAGPTVERLRDGARVVIGGPPNAGKSTLLNLLAERDAAIVSPIAGTTRDRVEAPLIRAGATYVLVDTAGLTDTDDAVERIGVDRAERAIATADLLIWLGDEPPPRKPALWVHARADLPGRRELPSGCSLAVSHSDPPSIDRLWDRIATVTSVAVPHGGMTLRTRQRAACKSAADYMRVTNRADPLIIAEHLRLSSARLGGVLGIDATEAMLDTLFGRFCIGK